ncbi:hypothetical protein P3T73_16030 [Kiritimatiellota bacterium B12222]|nr:hypothetical protein P3T73_16030 [Kiritimatiellota bacterium B12222]
MEVAIAIGILGLQLFCYLGIPLAWKFFRSRSLSCSVEELWVMGVLMVSLQAISGTLWTLLLATHLPPILEGLIFCGGGLLVGEFFYKRPLESSPVSSKIWLTLLLGITCFSRIIPAIAHSSLGQSDAYGHLQFGMELLAEGRLRLHSFYPVGHGWVHTLPAQFFPIDPYTLYRYGGTFYGLGLVLGIYMTARRAFSESTAICASLLVAGFPLFIPLIKTGVGVFANQLGLLLVPYLLWAVSRRFSLALPALLALGLSVPMMMLDLLPVLGIYLLIKGSRKQVALLVFLGLSGVGCILYKLLRLPPEHLEATIHLLSGQKDLHTLSHLFLHYLSWKPVALSPLIQAAVAVCSLGAVGLIAFPTWRHRNRILFPLLVGICGIQSFAGCLQFGQYQRAGWLFLLGIAFIAGEVGWQLSQRLHLSFLVKPALACSCLLLLCIPPTHNSHLSASEDELVSFLQDIPNDAQGDIWTRPFNNFAGGQGDPVRIMLWQNKGMNVRQIQATTQPSFDPQKKTWVLIDSAPPVPTGQIEFDHEIQKFWSRNQVLRTAVEQSSNRAHTKIERPGLEIWIFPATPPQP